MLDGDKLIYLGVITGSHGIKGHVTIKSFTDNSKTIPSLPIEDQNGTEIRLKFIRESKNDIICSILGVNDRNSSDNYRGTKLYTKRSNLPLLENSEYYIEDLVGMKLISNGKIIASIVAIHNFGAGDLIEISCEGEKSELYPFTKEFFPEIHKDYVEFKVNESSRK